MRIPEGSGVISAKLETKADGKHYPAGAGTVVAFGSNKPAEPKQK